MDEIEKICNVFDKFQKEEISYKDARKKLLSLVKKWKRKRTAASKENKLAP